MSKRAKSNQVRIIAGQWRGRPVSLIDSDGLRPTIDRVRETLFNWLMFDLNEATVLDLYAGSGVLGLECLSRGAAHVDFVERDTHVAATIQSNLDSFLSTVSAASVTQKATSPSARVHRQSAQAFLATSIAHKYNVVFVDPPFQSTELDDILNALESSACLANEAFIYVERDKNSSVLNVPEIWREHRSGKAGQSQYHLYQRL